MNGLTEGSRPGTLMERDVTQSPLERAKRHKQELTQATSDVDRLITLLEKNPEIEELLKLSRRFL